MRRTEMSVSGRRKTAGLIRHRNRMGYLFISPFILGLALIFLPTIIASARYALSGVEVKLGHVAANFIGLENFRQALFVNIDFRQILVAALRAMLLDMLIILLFSFFIATILNQRFFYRPFARLIFFLPVILSTGIVAAADNGNMLSSLFQSSSNTGESIVTAFGGTSSFFDLQGLIASANVSRQMTDTILYAINNTYTIVNASGIQIMIFLSALQTISPSIFEAAKVEGATKWEEFWKITFPMLTPMILVNIVYTIVDSFANPRYRTLDYIQDQAFRQNHIGLASAMSWLYFLLVMAILGVTWLLVARRVHYLD